MLLAVSLLAALFVALLPSLLLFAVLLSPLLLALLALAGTTSFAALPSEALASRPLLGGLLWTLFAVSLLAALFVALPSESLSFTASLFRLSLTPSLSRPLLTLAARGSTLLPFALLLHLPGLLASLLLAALGASSASGRLVSSSLVLLPALS